MRHPRPLIPFGVVLLALACKGKAITEPFPGSPPPPGGTPAALAFGLGGLGFDQVADVAVAPDGSVYLTGTFSGSVDFDPGPGITALTSLGLTDIFLAKYTSSGALVWADRIGGAGADVVVSLTRDTGGNLYIGGTFEGSSDFDPGAANQVLISQGATDGFVAKYSAAGALVWARRFGGPAGDLVADVAVDGTGNVYAVGTFAGAADALPTAGGQVVSDGPSPDGFVLSLDAAGSVRYAFAVGGPDSDAATAVTVTSDGSVVVGGSFRGNADFAPGTAIGPLVSAGGNDAFLASYTAAGVLRWARALSGVGDEGVQTGGLAADAAGGVAVTGNFTGTTDFDPGPAVVARSSLGATDWYIAHFDAAGGFQSVFTVGGTGADPAPHIAIDAEGNILATGGFLGTVDFDPGAALHVLTSLATAGSDIFAARYTLAGGLLWVSSFGEVSSAADRLNTGNAIAPAPSGTAIVVGRFFGSPNFGTAAVPFVLTSLGDADGFAVKLGSTGALVTNP